MLQQWCELVDSYLEGCHLEVQPLLGVTARVRRSRRRPYCDVGDAFEEALKRYGAGIKKIEDMSFELGTELGKVRLADIDAFIMIAATTGVSAEALELAHAKSPELPLCDRLHVAMPKVYNDGFIRKRLSYYGISLDLFEDTELERGVVCARAISIILGRKLREKALEEARATEFNPGIGIITALPIEYEAMTSLLGKPRPQRLRKGGRYQEYIHGTLPGHNGGEHDIVVACVGVGNNISAALTERLFNSFDLEEVFLVGIAGGIPYVKAGHADVRLGDVVVSGRAGIIQYDMIKQKPGDPEPHHPARPPSAAWLTRCQALINSATEISAFNSRLAIVTEKTRFSRPRNATDKLFDDTDPKNLKVIRRPRRTDTRSLAFEGPVGSANCVMKSHSDREKLRAKYGLLAVEMEGSGVADAAMANGKPFFVIRSICDYANAGKNDVWHPFAAMSAAVFAATLIESMPLSESG